jgi:hypothetical protein
VALGRWQRVAQCLQRLSRLRRRWHLVGMRLKEVKAQHLERLARLRRWWHLVGKHLKEVKTRGRLE